MADPLIEIGLIFLQDIKINNFNWWIKKNNRNRGGSGNEIDMGISININNYRIIHENKIDRKSDVCMQQQT